MTSSPLRLRRLLVRFALLFAVAQFVAAVGAILTFPAFRSPPTLAALLVVVGVADLALLALFARWIDRGSLDGPMERLAADIHRIADGDYHHRIGDPRRDELRELRNSVNRLADRLIQDQRLLAENIRSLEETNRELILVRDEMVQSARLASVGTLAAGIAHEVGNPLGAITGFVDVARARAGKAGGDTELLDLIRSEANRIDLIVRGLLDYARPRGSDSGPSPAADVVRGVRELLENQGKLTTVRVTWELDEAHPHMIAEPHRIQQVLVNLLLNAVDALERTKEPRISVRLHGELGQATRLRPRREDDPPGINYMHRRRMSRREGVTEPVDRSDRIVVIEVTDNGPGIPPDQLEHVFDPFFTTKEPGKGTGLGLSICARLVEGMGGRIDVKPADGGGASFLIRLPGLPDPDAATVDSVRSKALEAP